MKAYLKMYRWAMQMKMHMAMYTFVAIFLKILCNMLQGIETISIQELVTMWLVSLVFAMVETVIFPENAACTKGRSLIWLVSANACFAGGALIFGWFTGLPGWGGWLLLAFLELGLGLMWFGDRFVLKMDSAELTQQLKQYQKDMKK